MMAKLDDIRGAGYDVVLAWQGWADMPSVYAVSRETPPDPDAGIVGVSQSYLPDDPDMLDAFLAAAKEASE